MKNVFTSELSIEPTGVYIKGELYCKNESDFWQDVGENKINLIDDERKDEEIDS